MKVINNIGFFLVLYAIFALLFCVLGMMWEESDTFYWLYDILRHTWFIVGTMGVILLFYRGRKFQK